MTLAATSTASPDLERLPSTSLLRFYDPSTQGNSFSLDGFPAMGTVPERGDSPKNWQARLAEFIRLKGALGMTTNQTLFRQLLETGVLDDRLRVFKKEGRSATWIYQVLYNEAATEAARIFSPVNSRWPSEGRVSQEASALLTELEPLVQEVRRIAEAMRGVAAFTKVPNLKIGPQAVRAATATGQVNPNVTLVFSDRHYLDTAEGYLQGLQELAGRKQDLSGFFSVNSLFVSRVDRVVDPMIDEALKGSRKRVPGLRPGTPVELLKGKTAVAQAKKIYQIFETIFLGKPFADPEGLYADSEGQGMRRRMEELTLLFRKLKAQGAQPQRLLIASSGVKSDQPYSPLLYVLPFFGPWCANTMPEGTLDEVSRFAATLSDSQAAALKKRSLMSEPLPAVPTPLQPVGEWDRILLLTPEQRRREGITDWSPDRVLREVHRLVLQPKGTTLRAICDTLRDKGAESFLADERATLQGIEAKLERL